MSLPYNKKLIPIAKELRKNSTPQENHLWYDFLRGYFVKFQRQKPIDNYIVDFYCASAKIVIELDGSQHYENSGLLKDRIRTQQIEKRNLTVLRIPNNEVMNNFDGVCEYIDNYVAESLSQHS